MDYTNETKNQTPLNSSDNLTVEVWTGDKHGQLKLGDGAISMVDDSGNSLFKTPLGDIGHIKFYPGGFMVYAKDGLFKSYDINLYDNIALANSIKKKHGSLSAGYEAFTFQSKFNAAWRPTLETNDKIRSLITRKGVDVKGDVRPHLAKMYFIGFAVTLACIVIIYLVLIIVAVVLRHYYPNCDIPLPRGGNLCH